MTKIMDTNFIGKNTMKWTAQQSVHPTPGSLATSQAVFYALSFSTSDGVPPPAPARVSPDGDDVANRWAAS